ncbi:hypothetical protein NA56DRAFT_745524 [Hyaloscypha hepaticicola]|uniref:Uncharacterized protein n=1 Tax=Hyaloscypha hepaticicola TaxID=2082293 RepID=A0A2J6QF73_9HELO|nr:hypothetical protein NA56DRAFT_745524 [Hyaloscypha hepaticicola]
MASNIQWGILKLDPPPTSSLLNKLSANTAGVNTDPTSQDATIRYEDSVREGNRETTTGVTSYSSYIDLDENSHTSFRTSKSKIQCARSSSYVVIEGMAALEIHVWFGPSFTQILTSQINPYA